MMILKRIKIFEHVTTRMAFVFTINKVKSVKNIPNGILWHRMRVNIKNV